MIKLEITKDGTLIREFMIQDEVWYNFTDDLSSKENYFPDMSTKVLWFKILLDGKFIGIVSLKNANLSTLEAHPAMISKHGKYIRDVFNELFRFILTTPDFINKLIVSIPFSRKIVYNCAKKIGFIDEGINRESFLKGGIFYDQWHLGLTKREIRGLTWAT